jgi:hypothetical protein
MSDEKVIFSRLEIDGYATQANVLSELEIDELTDPIERRQNGETLLRRGGTVAVRNLLQLPEIRRLSESKPRRELARSAIGDAAIPSLAFGPGSPDLDSSN